MDRSKFLTVGVVGAAGMVLPALADAKKRHMGPKFDSTLHLVSKHHKMNSRFNHEQHVRHDGLVVVARGPMGGQLDGAGYVAAVIMQGHRIGHGISEMYGPEDTEWDADVVADHGQFRVGSAMAHGVLIQPDSDDVYTYAWSMHVQLVH